MLFDPASDRVLIRGANGWLGRELIALIAGSRVPFLAIGSTSKTISVGSTSVVVQQDDLALAKDFEPNWFFDFAHLTREKEHNHTKHSYLEANLQINLRGLQFLSLASLEFAIFTSSGAAVRQAANPYIDSWYSISKVRLEELVWSAARSFKGETAIIRPWSITGLHVQRPLDYAFSNLATQTKSGIVQITSDRPVFRRYVFAKELIALAANKMRIGGGGFVLDSGGDLVSLEQVAELFSAETKSVLMEPNYTSPASPNRYYSTNESWLEACASTNFMPGSLRDQVRAWTQYLEEESN